MPYIDMRRQMRSRYLRRRRVLRTHPWWMRVFVAYMVVTGGLSGILLGAIIVNWLSPGHPVYQAVLAMLVRMFG